VKMSFRPTTYLLFDGVNDYIDLNTTGIIPDGTRTWTISAWVYREGDGIRVVIGNGRDSTTSGFVFKIANEARDKVESTFYNSSLGIRAWIGNATVPESRWNLIGFTHDGSTGRFYLNGVEEEKETISNVSVLKENISDNVRIGHRVAGGAAEFFKGRIAKVAVWGRCFSNKEMQDMYTGDVYPTSDMLGYWKLNEGSGSVAIDSSGRGNNGTINGSTWVI
jgi:hypothetical protein